MTVVCPIMLWVLGPQQKTMPLLLWSFDSNVWHYGERRNIGHQQLYNMPVGDKCFGEKRNGRVGVIAFFIKGSQECMTDKVIPEHTLRGKGESHVYNCDESVLGRRNSKGKCESAYHVQRRAMSQMCSYCRKNKMEIPRKYGQKVGRNKVYIKTLGHWRSSRRGVNDMTSFKTIILDFALRVEFGF